MFSCYSSDTGTDVLVCKNNISRTFYVFRSCVIICETPGTLINRLPIWKQQSIIVVWFFIILSNDVMKSANSLFVLAMGKYALFLINLFVFFHSFVNIQSTVLSARIFSHYPRHNFSPGANFHRYHHFGFHYFHTASVESSILSRLLALPTTT